MLNPWLGFAYDAAWLALESQWVIAARMMRLAGGGRLARSEAHRMVSEKALAFMEAQMTTAAALAGGRKAPAAAKRGLRSYRKRVRSNRRRLLRSRRG